jgi:hypothetical protein
VNAAHVPGRTGELPNPLIQHHSYVSPISFRRCDRSNLSILGSRLRTARRPGARFCAEGSGAVQDADSRSHATGGKRQHRVDDKKNWLRTCGVGAAISASAKRRSAARSHPLGSAKTSECSMGGSGRHRVAAGLLYFTWECGHG